MYFLLQKIKIYRILVNCLTFYIILLYNSITYDVCNKFKIDIGGVANLKELINQKKDKEIKYMVLEKECKQELEEKF